MGIIRYVRALLMSSYSHLVTPMKKSFISISDHKLAYEFKYPKIIREGISTEYVFSRRLEKYSSAAPLSTDARRRIVCEIFDFTLSLTVSVTVDPLKETYKYSYTSQQLDMVDTMITEASAVSQNQLRKRKSKNI